MTSLRLSASLLCLLPLTLAAEPGAPAAAEQWDLVFEDNFDGTALDMTRWIWRGLGKRESAIISKDCVSLDGAGHLLLTVFEKDGVLHNPMIGTQGKFEATFGKFAARIKFPQMQGQHGSFWMQPARGAKVVDDPAASGVEIDIIEWFGAGRKDGGTASNLYWPGANGAKRHAGGTKDFGLLKPGQLLSDDFHVFAVEWDATGYTFTMDGQVTYRITEGISKVPQYMILSLLTADWEKDRLDRSKLPNAMVVDWVRAWQRPAGK